MDGIYFLTSGKRGELSHLSSFNAENDWADMTNVMRISRYTRLESPQSDFRLTIQGVLHVGGRKYHGSFIKVASRAMVMCLASYTDSFNAPEN